jgi:hypothetical protein
MTSERIVRQSELSTFFNCQQKWVLDSEQGREPHSVASFGGTVVADCIHLLHKHRIDDRSQIRSLVLSAIASNSEHAKWHVPDDAVALILERAEWMVNGYFDWVKSSPYEVLATEVEFRMPYGPGVTVGGRIDQLVLHKVTGAFGELDVKTYGAWAKAVTSQNIKPDLAREVQAGTYMLGMETDSTEYFIGVSNDHRMTPTQVLRDRYPSFKTQAKPSFYGLVVVSHLIPYFAGANKGELRGDVLFTERYSPALSQVAKDQIDNFLWSLAYPRRTRSQFYVGRGQTNCDTCWHKRVCWPTPDSPVPMDLPSSFNKFLED